MLNGRGMCSALLDCFLYSNSIGPEILSVLLPLFSYFIFRVHSFYWDEWFLAPAQRLSLHDASALIATSRQELLDRLRAANPSDNAKLEHALVSLLNHLSLPSSRSTVAHFKTLFANSSFNRSQITTSFISLLPSRCFLLLLSGQMTSLLQNSFCCR